MININLEFVFLEFVDVYKYLSLNIIIMKYTLLNKLLLKHSKALKLRIDKLNINIFTILCLNLFTLN